MKRVFRVARYVPDGAVTTNLSDPQVLVVGESLRHVNSFMEWHQIIWPTWVLDEISLSDPIARRLARIGSGLYIVGSASDGSQAIYRYNDTSHAVLLTV